MNYDELIEKYQSLLSENKNLKAEIANLKTQLYLETPGANSDELSLDKYEPEQDVKEATLQESPSNIDNMSEPQEKIKLFMSLFKGRDDVYAKRWENHKKGSSGYSPVCLNEWKHGICHKPKTPCTKCNHKAYPPLNETVIDMHLRGYKNFIAGIFPLCLDETCYFLAIDFDGDDWEKDISAIREVCLEFCIPLAVERSRSGKGAHAWFFFESAISAALARKFGSALLTYAMGKRHKIKFNSYDRFFPNQDTMPRGGLGNLIALPLQKVARENDNSEFVDKNGQSYKDQWAYLSGLKKLTENDIETLTTKLCYGNELGDLREDEAEEKPWESRKLKLQAHDFPKHLEIVRANMLFIPKAGISQQALNYLKRGRKEQSDRGC